MTDLDDNLNLGDPLNTPESILKRLNELQNRRFLVETEVDEILSATPKLIAALERVRFIHAGNENGNCEHCMWGGPKGKVYKWPCPTVKAIKAALGENQ